MNMTQLQEQLEVTPENRIRLLDFMWGDAVVTPLSRLSDKTHALDQLKGLGTSDIQLSN